MDCVAVYENGRIYRPRVPPAAQGDLVVVGRTEDAEEGIYRAPERLPRGRSSAERRLPSARAARRETAFSRDYDELYDLLRHERDHGKIVWVMGPAFAFDHDARDGLRQARSKTAMSTPCWRATRWPPTIWRRPTSTRRSGRTSTRRRSVPNGHYQPSGHHQPRAATTAAFARLHAKRSTSTTASSTAAKSAAFPMCWRAPSATTARCRRCYGDVYAAQDAMRDQIRGATTVICMATMLHTIATGNMTPLVPRAAGRHGAAGVFLLRGRVGIRGEQAG